MENCWFSFINVSSGSRLCNSDGAKVDSADQLESKFIKAHITGERKQVVESTC